MTAKSTAPKKIVLFRIHNPATRHAKHTADAPIKRKA